MTAPLIEYDFAHHAAKNEDGSYEALAAYFTVPEAFEQPDVVVDGVVVTDAFRFDGRRYVWIDTATALRRPEIAVELVVLLNEIDGDQCLFSSAEVPLDLRLRTSDGGRSFVVLAQAGYRRDGVPVLTTCSSEQTGKTLSPGKWARIMLIHGMRELVILIDGEVAGRRVISPGAVVAWGEHRGWYVGMAPDGESDGLHGLIGHLRFWNEDPDDWNEGRKAAENDGLGVVHSRWENEGGPESFLGGRVGIERVSDLGRIGDFERGEIYWLRSQVSRQKGFRRCSKCKGLWFTRHGNAECGGGGFHAAEGASYAVTDNAPSEPGQRGWRWCRKCQCISFIEHGVGPCPVGGNHDVSGSGSYALLDNPVPWIGQGGWRWCRNCQMIHRTSGGAGRCVAGTHHVAEGSGRYRLVQESSNDQTVVVQEGLMRDRYRQLAGAFGDLGWPLRDAKSENGGMIQVFEKGVITFANGVVAALWGEIAASWYGARVDAG